MRMGFEIGCSSSEVVVCASNGELKRLRQSAKRRTRNFFNKPPNYLVTSHSQSFVMLCSETPTANFLLSIFNKYTAFLCAMG